MSLSRVVLGATTVVGGLVAGVLAYQTTRVPAESLRVEPQPRTTVTRVVCEPPAVRSGDGCVRTVVVTQPPAPPVVVPAVATTTDPPRARVPRPPAPAVTDRDHHDDHDEEDDD